MHTLLSNCDKVDSSSWYTVPAKTRMNLPGMRGRNHTCGSLPAGNSITFARNSNRLPLASDFPL